ncbi:MAG: HypC/HybG/HupF family hydrogenase formation chaperone [Candidatus Eremiobacteraeota bacterium]|nr:HypC/HybG/HupF family hydrogenase formation chaperone [Candidatus Eremiobacteraeota bacterium]
MCLAIPGQVVEFPADKPLFAKIDVGGVRRTVNVGLLEDEALRIGDWVLIHVGFAMSKIDAEQAEEQLRLLATLGEDAPALEEFSGYSFADPSLRPGSGQAM